MRFFLILFVSLFYSSQHFMAQENDSYKKNVDTLNVKKYGVLGDGISDDWSSIQKLIDSLANNSGGVLFFPKGTYVIEDKTLLLWGSNISLYGESKTETILEKRGRAGWWGELLAISGKSPGGKYYGSFGNSDYNRFVIYNGKNVPSDNISISSFTFRTNSKDISSMANNVGIFNSNQVYITNCIFSGAPQSNLAIVNNTIKSVNKNVSISNCIFQNSGKHNVRVISYNQGEYLGNKVVINNSYFCNVRSADTLREIKGKKVHLWYRAGRGSNAISLTVSNSDFDETGSIISTVNSSNFTLKYSKVNNVIELNSHRNYKQGVVTLIGNEFANRVFITNKTKLLWQENISNEKSTIENPRTYKVQEIID